MSRHTGRRRTCVTFGVSAIAFVLAVLVLDSCSPTSAPTGAPTSPGLDPTGQLRALETPVLRDVKAASSALTANNLSAASDALEQIGRDGAAILDWLEAHPDFVKANRSTTDCLEETMKDLGEQAQDLAPALRAGTATTAQTQKLNADLGEAANCIQTSD